MKKSPKIDLYEFEFWPSADDKLGINQRLAENIEIKYSEQDQHPGELLIRASAKAESPQKAFEKSLKYIDEFFDFYCALKGSPISIQPADQIDLLKPKMDPSKWHGFGSITYHPFSLNRKEGEFVYSSIKKLRVRKFNFLTLAMKYYRNAKLHEKISDKLINYFIALESLYSDGDEITYRFSNRMAILLGKTFSQRKILVEKGKKMYGYRSKIVHGIGTESNEDSIKEVDAWVKNSILSFMELMNYYNTRKEILQKLDKAMLDEKTRIKLQKQRRFKR